MTRIKLLNAVFCVLLFTLSITVQSQLNSGIYISDVENVRHELKINNGYLIHTVYEGSPAKFIKTLGGFYTAENGIINLKLEFNSAFEEDGIKEMKIPFVVEKDKLTFTTDAPLFLCSLNQWNKTWMANGSLPPEAQMKDKIEGVRKTLERP